ncbi:substrate-binding domain-containing protein [Microbacterium sp. JZ37]|uniref:substrate-binding domain-containing protein n=1 Tax=Microbacterium sp. JZ37 TaxID=2654193 RepID=UPI002B4864C9|nr:substrate-binding domain-containing protein [Microbacterium sp. JZ37]
MTAIFASNDVMALGAAAALRDRGLAIPHDVSLVGYDDSPLANSRYLSFTTIDDRSRDVGAETARAILARLDDPEAEPRHIRLSPTLIDRGSTAPPRAR